MWLHIRLLYDSSVYLDVAVMIDEKVLRFQISVYEI